MVMPPGAIEEGVRAIKENVKLRAEVERLKEGVQQRSDEVLQERKKHGQALESWGKQGKRLEVAELQVGEARKLLTYFVSPIGDPFDEAKTCIDMEKEAKTWLANVGSHKSRDSRQSDAEMCECGHEAADHGYSFVSEGGHGAGYYPTKCRNCECTKPTLCKRR